MNLIPIIDNWNWYHAPIAVGAPVFVGVFFMNTTPVLSHAFWLTFSLSLVFMGMVGMTATRRKRDKETGNRSWVWKHTLIGWILTVFFLCSFLSAILIGAKEII